jgi:hypothetical protein
MAAFGTWSSFEIFNDLNCLEVHSQIAQYAFDALA